MSPRSTRSRDEQRQARTIQSEQGIPYVKALSLAREGASRSGWLKSIYARRAGWTIDPGERSWVSDIGRHDADGNRVYRRDEKPWGQPRWKVGDHVGLYFAGTFRVPVLVEVIASPRFDPAFVDQHNDSGHTNPGERWPWVTEVRGVMAVPLDRAPRLDDIGVDHDSMRQRGRLVLRPQQLAQLKGGLQ